MVSCRYFAIAREIVGGSVEHYEAAPSVGDLVKVIIDRHGESFQKILGISAIWVNGDPATLDTELHDGDEMAILPPVSGGM